MPYYRFIWEDFNADHVAQHGVTIDEAECVVLDPSSTAGTSKSSGRPTATGWTHTGKFLHVVYEELDDWTVYIVTAYEVSP